MGWPSSTGSTRSWRCWRPCAAAGAARTVITLVVAAQGTSQALRLAAGTVVAAAEMTLGPPVAAAGLTMLGKTARVSLGAVGGGGASAADRGAQCRHGLTLPRFLPLQPHTRRMLATRSQRRFKMLTTPSLQLLLSLRSWATRGLSVLLPVLLPVPMVRLQPLLRLQLLSRAALPLHVPTQLPFCRRLRLLLHSTQCSHLKQWQLRRKRCLFERWSARASLMSIRC